MGNGGSRTLSSGPNFAVIGAQKAASTALLQALRAHPDVWMAPDEDPFLRDPLYRRSNVPTFKAAYAGRPEKAVGLKCPDYLARPEVPARLAEHLADPRLIAILRNPIDRAVSAYYWHVRWGLLPVEDVNQGLRRVLRGDHPTDPTAPDILTWGLYHQHLCRYLGYADRARLLVLFDTDLRADRRAALRDVFNFLEVDASWTAEASSGTANEGVYSLPRLRFLQRRNHLVMTWHDDTYGNIHPARGIGGRAVSGSVAALDRYVLARVFGNSKPELEPDLRAELEDYYSEDCRALPSVTGRPNPPGWPG